MKKKIAVLSLAAVLIISCVATKISGKRVKNAPESNDNLSGESFEAAFEEIPANTTPVSKDVYTVKEYNEKVGIFKNTNTEPYIVLDVYTFVLPQADRALLKEGFVIDADKLYSIIEDYTG